jgi:hypothetical protein
MQNSKQIIAFLLLVITLSWSCTKLDEELYSDVPTNEFGQNDKEINALVGPIYSTLKGHNLSWDFYMVMDELAGGMMAVPGFKGGDWGEPMWRETMTHNWEANSYGFNWAWFHPMSSIALCNQIYYQVENNEAMAADDKERTLAEIRGVRAFWYYTLVDHYGNVPIVTDFLDRSQPATKSRKEVYTFIISELNEIKDKLRSDVSMATYGKMTKGAANMILAKMYLNAMVWDPSGGPKWQECIDACNEILALPYILEPNWKTNFIPKNEVSKEAIFSAVFKAGGSGLQNDISLNTLHYLDPIALGLNVASWNGYGAHPEYINEFDTTDTRYHGSFLIGPMIDPSTGQVITTVHGRPLIHTTTMTINEPDAEGWGWINQEDGARCYKWDFEPGLSTSMENDIHIFRLADVYLMKAEAILRNGGNVAEATELVNRVRERGFPNKPGKLYTSVTLADILQERRFELAWEGYSRQDLIRYGKFLDVQLPFRKRASDPKFLLFNIPKLAIDANDKLIQNPGF